MFQVTLLYTGFVLGDVLLSLGAFTWMKNSETATAFDYDRESRRKGRALGKFLVLAGLASCVGSLAIVICD